MSQGAGMFYTMGLNPAQFIGGVNQAGAALSGFASQHTSVVSRIKGLWLGLSGALAGLAVWKALEKSMQNEKAFVAMNTLLKNAQATRAIMREISTMDKESPIGGAEWKEAANELLSGGENVRTVTGFLRDMGDVATGAGVPLGELVGMISKARIKGGLDNFGLRELTAMRLDEVIDALKEIKNIPTFGALRDAAEKGEISFEDLRKAIQSVGGAGGAFFGAMSAQAGTTAGMIERVRRGFMDVLLVFTNPASDALKPLLQGALDVLTKAKKAAQDLVTALGMAAGEGHLADAIGEALKLAFATAANFGAKVFAGLGSVWGGIADLGIDAMTRIGGALKLALFDAFDAVVDNAGWIQKMVGGMSKVSTGARINALMQKTQGGLNDDQTGPLRDQGIKKLMGFMAAFDAQGDVKDAATPLKNLQQLFRLARNRIASMAKDENAALQSKGAAQQTAADDAERAENVWKSNERQMERFQKASEGLAKMFPGIFGAMGGAAGALGGGAPAGPGALTRGGGLNPLQQAVKQFLSLSPEAMKKYEFDPFANNGRGQHRGMNEAFERFINDHGWLKPGIAEWGKKNKLTPNGMRDLHDFIANQPAEFFAKVPGARNAGNPNNPQLAAIEKVLNEIKSNLKVK